MLKKYAFFAGLASVALVTSCADEDLAPVVVPTELAIGAFPRLVTLTSGEFDLENLGDTEVAYTVEFVDDNNGQNVAEYRVFGSFQDRDRSNGDQSAPEVLLRTFNASEFGTSEAGLPSVTFSISSNEVVETFGIDTDLITPGDRIRLRTELTKTDGTVFSEENSSSAITGAFGGIWDLPGTYTCPLPDDFLVGDYAYTYTGGNANGGFGPIFGPEGTVTLELVEGSSTRRKFTTAYIGSFEVEPIIDFVCTTANGLTVNTGVGCGGGSIELGAGGPGDFDITDDGSFSINLVQFSADGGCGAAPTPVEISFTKQ